MKLTSVSLCLLVGSALALAFPGHVSVKFNDGTIIGGVDADKGEFPWQVSFQLKDGDEFRHICGGSILDATHIITAGHCLDGQVESSLQIVAGGHNITDKKEASQQHIEVESYTIHEGYNGITIQNDIGIMILKTPIDFNEYAQPINRCEQDPARSEDVVNTGWGNAHPEGGTPIVLPDILQKVTLSAMTDLACRRFYPLILREYMLCATGTGEGPSGACNGDSGGPLVYKLADEYCLAGIVSFGRQPCGNAPSVYTSVASFADWINPILNK